MPLPTLRLPMASTSSLEFLGVTVSGEAMGACWPGCGLVLSGGGGGGCCWDGALMSGCWPLGDWPAGSWDCARAAPEKSSAVRMAPSSLGELGCMSLPPQRVVYTRSAYGL